MKKLFRSIALFTILLSLAAPALAQSDAEFRVHAQRLFGYSSGSQVRGSFSLSIVGSQENIRSVTYLIDGAEMGTVSAPPFKFNFKTSNYPDGSHALSAKVSTQDNRQVTTPAVEYTFLSAGQESDSMKKILIPVFGLVFGIMLVGVGAQLVMTRRGGPPAPGAERHYGLKGGTICPRCGRAYAIHFWSLNLVGSYLDRCDYCGKVAFVRRRSRAELDAAVQAEAAAAQAGESSLPGVQEQQSEEERLKKMMDESKYMD